MPVENLETAATLQRGLQQSRSNLQQTLTGVDEEICSLKPDNETWSIKENVEHLAIIELRLATMLESRLPGTDVLPDAVPSTPEEDLQIAERVSSCMEKFKAPEAVTPTGRYPTCVQALDAFLAARQNTIDLVPKLQPYLRKRYLPHPLFGSLDGHTWFLILGAHTERHAKQIEEVKAALAHQ